MTISPWQIWWANLDPVAGHEQAGTRPVVVVSSDFHLQLTRHSLVTVLPLTTRVRPYRHRVEIKGPGATSYVITEQVRTISANRLTRLAHQLDADEVAEVRRILTMMVDLGP